MMKSVILALCLGAASAFTNAPSAPTRNVAAFETKADLEALAKELNPVIGYYDPLGLANGNMWGMGNEATIGFLRHAEIKHGRVAMAAFVGYVLSSNGVHFPWPAVGGGVEITSTSPPEVWDQIPFEAKAQILGLIFFLEWWSECGERVGNPKHYMAGGKPGAFPSFKGNVPAAPHIMPFDLYDPFGFSKNKSEAAKARGRLVEINNGRLAQIGIIAFAMEQKLPGSVPALSGLVQHYDGEFMAPF